MFRDQPEKNIMLVMMDTCQNAYMAACWAFNVVANRCIHKVSKITLGSAVRKRFLSGWKSASFSESVIRSTYKKTIQYADQGCVIFSKIIEWRCIICDTVPIR